VVSGEEQVSSVRGRERRAILNHELRVGFLLPATEHRLLLTSDYLLHSGEVRVGGTLAPLLSLRQDVTTCRERKN